MIRRPLSPPNEREVVRWPCPGGCGEVYGVYRGSAPRHWYTEADGRLVCPPCHRRLRKAAERKAKR